jgi:hypothetical protein
VGGGFAQPTGEILSVVSLPSQLAIIYLGFSQSRRHAAYGVTIGN